MFHSFYWSIICVCFHFMKKVFSKYGLFLFYNAISHHFISDHSKSNKDESQESLICNRVLQSYQQCRKKFFLIVFQLENQYKQMFCSWLAKKISIFLGSTYRVEISSSHWKNRSQHGNKLWTDKLSEMGLPPFLCINSINFIPSLWHWEVVFWHLLTDLIFWVWEYRKEMKLTQ